MKLTTRLLSIAWVPLLSGCMMLGGTGHTSDLSGGDDAGDGWGPASPQRAEASSDGLTIALSFPVPTGGAAVPIDARLQLDSVRSVPSDGDVWLRIETPSGRVERRQMQRLDSSAPGAYRAIYSFPAAGVYLVTAEGRTGAGPEVRTVSVTARADVSEHPYHGRHDWLMPVGILWGLGMVAMMALMLGGS